MVVLLRRRADPEDSTGSAGWSGGRGTMVRCAPRSPPLGLSPPAVAGVVGYSPAGSTVSVQDGAAVAAVAVAGHNDEKRAATTTRTTRSASS